MNTPMSRRKVLSKAVTSAAAAAVVGDLGRRVAAAERLGGLKGRIRHSVCRWCYDKVPFGGFVSGVAGVGIASIDLLGLDEIPTAKKHELTCAMVSGIPGGITKGLNRVENHAAIRKWFEGAAPKVVTWGART